MRPSMEIIPIQSIKGKKIKSEEWEFGPMLYKRFDICPSTIESQT